MLIHSPKPCESKLRIAGGLSQRFPATLSRRSEEKFAFPKVMLAGMH